MKEYFEERLSFDIRRVVFTGAQPMGDILSKKLNRDDSEGKGEEGKRTRFIMVIDSTERNFGYLTSSLTMESNTSSSSSPGNGDSPTNIS